MSWMSGKCICVPYDINIPIHHIVGVKTAKRIGTQPTVNQQTKAKIKRRSCKSCRYRSECNGSSTNHYVYFPKDAV